MKLIRFEILGFRSINDAICEVDPKITVLAGKNESGKTNILDALERISNPELYDERTDDPEGFIEITPTIRLEYQLSKEEIDVLKHGPSWLESEGFIHNESNFSATCSKNLIVTKNLKEKILDVGGSFYNECLKYIKISLEQNTKDFNSVLKQFNEGNRETKILNSVPLLNSRNISVDNESLNSLKDRKKSLTQIKQNLQNLDFNLIENFLDDLIQIIKSAQNLKKEIINKIPKFVLFKSFEYKLRDIVPVNQLIGNISEENRINKDLLNIYKITDEILQDSNIQYKSTKFNEATLNSTEEFSNYWNQDDINITIEDKGSNICFWLSDAGQTKRFRPQQRSKELQWYLAFFIRMKSEGFENSIILIDEPGAYLHAKAQQDVLTLLEDISNENQIIFSTHSPYLIDADKLFRIRLIERNAEMNITDIINKFNKGSDDETLTPIITALGFDISRNLFFSKKMNVILEGVSDYHYFVTILDYLKKKKNYEFPEEIGFMPATGHTKVSNLVSIMIGWDLNYVIVLDRKGTNITFEKLEEDGLTDKVIFVGKNEEDSIEELFDEIDAEKYGIKKLTATKDKDKKKLKGKKAAIAKNFALKTLEEDFLLTENTLENFIEILNRISQHIS